jgi:hypothetical protein
MTKRALSVLMVVALIGGLLATSAIDASAAKKKKKKKVCKAYKPGELGAEAETSKITAKATEEAPVELTLATEPGFGIGGNDTTAANISHVYHNIQVDPKTKATGLYVRLEMPQGTDYDIYLMNPDGTEAAHAAGFNPIPHALIGDGTGTGGHSEETAEQLDGILSKDCQGYTLDVANATGTGGDVTLKMWLGEATYDPTAAQEG